MGWHLSHELVSVELLRVQVTSHLHTVMSNNILVSENLADCTVILMINVK